jgi:hypothetical protein
MIANFDFVKNNSYLPQVFGLQIYQSNISEVCIEFTANQRKAMNGYLLSLNEFNRTLQAIQKLYSVRPIDVEQIVDLLKY